MLLALTGATGFIGQHLLRELPKRGYRVRVLLRRLRCFIGNRLTSLRLDAGFLDNRRPTSDLSCLFGSQRFRCLLIRRPDILAHRTEAFLDNGISEGLSNGRVELGDYLFWRAFRHPYAVPEARVDVVNAKLVERWHLRRRPPPLRLDNRISLEFAISDVC